MKANLHTTAAETLVAGEPAVVYEAVVELVERLWPGMTDIVRSEPPAQLVLAVTVEGTVDSWLTWELTASGASWTRARQVHDEVDTSAGPPPEVDAVLALLIEAARKPAGAATLSAP